MVTGELARPRMESREPAMLPSPTTHRAPRAVRKAQATRSLPYGRFSVTGLDISLAPMTFNARSEAPSSISLPFSAQIDRDSIEYLSSKSNCVDRSDRGAVQVQSWATLLAL